MDSAVECSNCSLSVDPDASWCPHCGALFEQSAVCREHPAEEADGVCVICSVPCCSECGLWVNEIFLCGAHQDYEIMEDRARVYGTTDMLAAEYASRCLEQGEFHPFVFSRKAYRNMDMAPNFSYRQFGSHNAAEVKVFVPFHEVIPAESLLRRLTLLPE